MDVLRGFALFGICIANTVTVTEMPLVTWPDDVGAAYWTYQTLLNERFFPIFAFLFGLSFGLFLNGVRERTNNPRLIMLARLGFLIPFGGIHRLLQPDEVLLTYAVVGMVVLMPASFLPGWRPMLMLGGVGTAWAAALSTNGSLLIPGLFLLGYAVNRYGVEKVLSLPVSRMLRALAGWLTLAVLLNVLEIDGGAGSFRLAGIAGLATAATYALVILLLLRSGVRRILLKLAPLGRMALTSYIGATVLIVAADQFVNLGDSTDYGMAVSLGVGVFAIALGFSWLWLRYARYGPLEWVWRCLTWWKIVPNGSSRA